MHTHNSEFDHYYILHRFTVKLTSLTRNSTTLGGVAAMTTASRETNRKLSRSDNIVNIAYRFS